MRVLGGGEYATEQAILYLIHSSKCIQLWVSNHPQLKSVLMIRNIVARNTQVNDGSDRRKYVIREDYHAHNVIVGSRSDQNCLVNLFDSYIFGQNMLKLMVGCDCVGGSKTITLDSHCVAALLYLRYWITQTSLPNKLKSQKKYRHLIDIEGFRQCLIKLSKTDLAKYALRWTKKHSIYS